MLRVTVDDRRSKSFKNVALLKMGAMGVQPPKRYKRHHLISYLTGSKAKLDDTENELEIVDELEEPLPEFKPGWVARAEDNAEGAEETSNKGSFYTQNLVLTF